MRVPTRLAARLGPPLDALRQVAANPGLFRLELGSLAFGAADLMYVVGLAVLAYEAGGTAAVAVLAIIRALPSVVLVPMLLAATDAIPRDRLLRLVVATRVACLVVATALVIGDAFLFAIYLLAGIDAVAGGLLRPLRATLTPALARSAEELVAANAVTTTGDALGAILGPGGAALILVAGDVPAALVAGTIVMIVALGVVFPIKAAPDISTRTPLRTGWTRGRRTKVPCCSRCGHCWRCPTRD